MLRVCLDKHPEQWHLPVRVQGLSVPGAGLGFPCLAPDACIERLLAGSKGAVGMGDLKRELLVAGASQIFNLTPLF